MKIIIREDVFDLILAARMAKRALDCTEWPANNILCVQYGDPDGPIFLAKRNKSSITIRQAPN